MNPHQLAIEPISWLSKSGSKHRNLYDPIKDTDLHHDPSFPPDDFIGFHTSLTPQSIVDRFRYDLRSGQREMISFDLPSQAQSPLPAFRQAGSRSRNAGTCHRSRHATDLKWLHMRSIQLDLPDLCTSALTVLTTCPASMIYCSNCIRCIAVVG